MHLPIRSVARATRTLGFLTGLLPVAAELTSQQNPPQRSAIADTIVRVASSPRHAGVATLVQEISIGEVSGVSEYLLGHVRDILPARDGTVWILDGNLFGGGGIQLRRYDSAGRLLRVVARAGAGPGELQRSVNLAQMPDGRVLVWETAGVMRLKVYSEAGDYLNTLTLDQSGGAAGGGFGALQVDGAGNVYARIALRNRPGQTDRFRAGDAIVRVSPGGTIVDTVPHPDNLPNQGSRPITVSGIGARGIGSVILSVPYAPQPLWSWSPLGYWITGTSTSYAFELRDPRLADNARSGGARVSGGSKVPPLWRPGQPVLSIRRDTPATAVTPPERAAQATFLEDYIRALKGKPQGSIPEIPSVKPAYSALVPDLDGRIWVRVATPSERYQPVTAQKNAAEPTAPEVPWRSPTVYDVFDPGGVYVGRVAVPYNTALCTMTGDVVWAVWSSPEGVESVKRFRISWSSQPRVSPHSSFGRRRP